jgi:hypothetical protein
MNAVAKLLSTDGFIQVNKTLIKKIGLHEAILIGELCAEYNYWDEQGKLEDGYFYSTRDNIEENTGLSEHYQRKALSHLYELGIILIEKRGLPAKNYYKIDFNILLSVIETSSCQRCRQQDAESVQINNNKQEKQVNKNTSKEVLQDFAFGNKQKPKKDNLYTKCVQLIDSYDFSCWGHIREQLIDYLNFRLSVKDKPLYTNMWKGMLNKLANLCVDDISKYEQVIQYSLERGYLSFYEPSNYSSAKSKPWESGVKSTTRTEEEKEADREFLAKMAAQGKKVVF